jgi:Cys-tRNA synthase (O-phospho-L-seryl-tRNA:Cys-tRNA synthase)
VDYLLIAKPVAINHSRIRRDCANAIHCFYRLLVVLNEGYHLCCFVATERSMLEICEIGEQGVSIVDYELLVRLLSERISKLQLDLQPF